jgi:hypothetical protein
MKNNKALPLLFLLVTIFTISIVETVYSLDTIIRPLKLKVVESETGKPVEGIPVYRLIRSKRYKKTIFFFFKNPDPSPFFTSLGENKRMTDQNGEVEFKRSEFTTIGRIDDVYETILINLSINKDIKEGAKNLSMTEIEYLDFTSNTDSVENFNKNYRGVRVDGTLMKINISEENLNFKVSSHDFIWNIEGLSRNSQSLVIKLEKIK